MATTENLSDFSCTPGEWKQISAVIAVIEGTFLKKKNSRIKTRGKSAVEFTDNISN